MRILQGSRGSFVVITHESLRFELINVSTIPLVMKPTRPSASKSISSIRTFAAPQSPRERVTCAVREMRSVGRLRTREIRVADKTIVNAAIDSKGL
jgi:hypothetical protein